MSRSGVAVNKSPWQGTCPWINSGSSGVGDSSTLVGNATHVVTNVIMCNTLCPNWLQEMVDVDLKCKIQSEQGRLASETLRPLQCRGHRVMITLTRSASPLLFYYSIYYSILFYYSTW